MKRILTEDWDGAQGETTGKSEAGAGWKILLFDSFTFEVLSSFKMGFLRDHNVTLHMHIDSNKEVA